MKTTINEVIDYLNNTYNQETEKNPENVLEKYADDCIIMVGSEIAANRVMKSISKFMEEKLLFWL